ncbi:MAG TPA: hypothetical protein VMD74_04270 [Candidatus Methylomirabilis sp.]|nr:hypothetical protein [Candidatus Methylomirabilis sp.]
MEKIYYGEKLIGLRIKTLAKGSTPVTEDKQPLQLVTLKHPAGAYLKAHAHRPRRRTTERLQECLMVKKGRIKLDLYGPDKKLFKHLFLAAGDIFISLNGGIGIHFLQDGEIIEVKNGPFKEDKILI